MMTERVTTKVVVSRPPNADWLQRQPFVPIPDIYLTIMISSVRIHLGSKKHFALALFPCQCEPWALSKNTALSKYVHEYVFKDNLRKGPLKHYVILLEGSEGGSPQKITKDHTWGGGHIKDHIGSQGGEGCFGRLGFLKEQKNKLGLSCTKLSTDLASFSWAWSYLPTNYSPSCGLKLGRDAA